MTSKEQLKSIVCTLFRKRGKQFLVYNKLRTILCLTRSASQLSARAVISLTHLRGSKSLVCLKGVELKREVSSQLLLLLYSAMVILRGAGRTLHCALWARISRQKGTYLQYNRGLNVGFFCLFGFHIV